MNSTKKDAIECEQFVENFLFHTNVAKVFKIHMETPGENIPFFILSNTIPKITHKIHGTTKKNYCFRYIKE